MAAASCEPDEMAPHTSRGIGRDTVRSGNSMAADVNNGKHRNQVYLNTTAHPLPVGQTQTHLASRTIIICIPVVRAPRPPAGSSIMSQSKLQNTTKSCVVSVRRRGKGREALFVVWFQVPYAKRPGKVAHGRVGLNLESPHAWASCFMFCVESTTTRDRLSSAYIGTSTRARAFICRYWPSLHPGAAWPGSRDWY